MRASDLCARTSAGNGALKRHVKAGSVMSKDPRGGGAWRRRGANAVVRCVGAPNGERNEERDAEPRVETRALCCGAGGASELFERTDEPFHDLWKVRASSS